MALIEFRSVKKSFGPKMVYDDLTLDVFKGESLTVIGGSGQGKSVMLKLLMGLLRVDAGTISFDNEDITRKSEHDYAPVRRRIGMLFQGSALFDSLTVAENVSYGLREHYRMSEQDIKERVAESLASVGLPGIESMWPADLSGGMKKRVGLARAIAIRPDVLLYDEPTTGLDPINTTRINLLILHLKDKYKMTSVVVTHDMHSAFTVSDRMVMIHHGKVVFSGTPAQIKSADDPMVKNFVEGTAPLETDISELLRS